MKYFVLISLLFISACSKQKDSEKPSVKHEQSAKPEEQKATSNKDNIQNKSSSNDKLAELSKGAPFPSGIYRMDILSLGEKLFNKVSTDSGANNIASNSRLILLGKELIITGLNNGCMFLELEKTSTPDELHVKGKGEYDEIGTKIKVIKNKTFYSVSFGDYSFNLIQDHNLDKELNLILDGKTESIHLLSYAPQNLNSLMFFSILAKDNSILKTLDQMGLLHQNEQFGSFLKAKIDISEPLKSLITKKEIDLVAVKTHLLKAKDKNVSIKVDPKLKAGQFMDNEGVFIWKLTKMSDRELDRVLNYEFYKPSLVLLVSDLLAVINEEDIEVIELKKFKGSNNTAILDNRDKFIFKQDGVDLIITIHESNEPYDVGLERLPDVDKALLAVLDDSITEKLFFSYNYQAQQAILVYSIVKNKIKPFSIIKNKKMIEGYDTGELEDIAEDYKRTEILNLLKGK